MMIGDTKKIKVLIVDDETLARKRIRDLLCNDDNFEIIGECSSGRETIEALQIKAPDLLFLDIQMPDMDGFKVLENLKTSKFPTIIFVTAYDKYALRAFEVHAIDYLLKPFKDKRFEETIDHIREKIKKNKIQNLSGKLTKLLASYQNQNLEDESEEIIQKEQIYQSRFIIKSTGKISIVNINEIDWIGSEGPYVSLNKKNNSQLMRESLKNLETKLDPKQFLRIHRSTIVNVFRIKELRPQSHGDYLVILDNGKKLKLSRRYREQIAKILGSEK